ncbi:hypothetical protein [Aneurinibacillus tyrosinisolvens]|uniref:hypothetical protein n=1 Tax=Aneurinibacillus tyrosinisolvens TaxID=1443435 RepID=UPI00063F4916|nr:hypothetical protein [Aneurinibacillus tyrosinisolvens]
MALLDRENIVNIVFMNRNEVMKELKGYINYLSAMDEAIREDESKELFLKKLAFQHMVSDYKSIEEDILSFENFTNPKRVDDFENGFAKSVFHSTSLPKSLKILEDGAIRQVREPKLYFSHESPTYFYHVLTLWSNEWLESLNYTGNMITFSCNISDIDYMKHIGWEDYSPFLPDKVLHAYIKSKHPDLERSPHIEITIEQDLPLSKINRFYFIKGYQVHQLYNRVDDDSWSVYTFKDRVVSHG